MAGNCLSMMVSRNDHEMTLLCNPWIFTWSLKKIRVIH